VAEVKNQFEGISKYNATMIFAALASNPNTTFMTTGFLGKLVFFFIEKFSTWLVNQGLALANIGLNKIFILQEKKDYNKAFDEAFNLILNTKEPLTKQQKDQIDEKIKAAFRKFGTFV